MMVIAALIVTAGPATANVAAPVNDGFWTATTTPSFCPEDFFIAGVVTFVDYGPGAPGGGDNDDYILVDDACADGDGVKAWAWLNGTCLASCSGKYNGNGSGSSVVWDPFPSGNVHRGDVVGLKICSVSGSGGLPYNCRETSRRSVDG